MTPPVTAITPEMMLANERALLARLESCTQAIRLELTPRILMHAQASRSERADYRRRLFESLGKRELLEEMVS